MADQLTTTTTLPPAIQTYYDRVLLKRALPYLIHEKFAQEKPVPKGTGSQIKFRKYNALSLPTTPLQEGVTPDAEDMSKTDIFANLQQWGGVLKITDMVQFISPDSVVTEAAELQGEQAGETLDEICRDTLLGSASVYYANAVANRASIITAPSTNDFDRIERALRAALAKYHTRMITASTGVGTTPIAPCFWVITHTDTILNIRGLTGFTPVQEYPKQQETIDGEYGALGNFRFVATTKSDIQADSGGTAVTNTLKYTTADTNCDVYRSIILAKDAYGRIPLNGESLNFYVQERGQGEDILRQRTKLGWKSTRCYRILNDSNMFIYEHGVSA